MMDVHNETLDKLSVKSNELYNNFHQLVEDKTDSITKVILDEWEFKNAKLSYLMGLLIKDFYIFEKYSVDNTYDKIYKVPKRFREITLYRNGYIIKCAFCIVENNDGSESYIPHHTEFKLDDRVDYCLSTQPLENYSLSIQPIKNVVITDWLDLRKIAQKRKNYLDVLEATIEHYYSYYLDKT